MQSNSWFSKPRSYLNLVIMFSREDKKYFCPSCKETLKKDQNLFFPFCSERCKLLDLGAWLKGEYKILNKSGLDLGNSVEN